MSILALLRKDPLGTLGRAFYKTFVGPLVYGRGTHYDARRYWNDRFGKYGASFQGSGYEGLSENENEAGYGIIAAELSGLCGREGVRLQGARVLEIGVGAGYYVPVLKAAGIASYTGVDITDKLFPELRARHPDCDFLRLDIGSDALGGGYDFILMLDVVQCLTTEAHFARAMGNLRGALAPGGALIMGPLGDENRKMHFYMRFWSLRDVLNALPGFSASAPAPFRAHRMYCFKASPAPDPGR